MEPLLDNPINLSPKAALELEEYRRGKRNDTPSLDKLFSFIRKPTTSGNFQGHEGISMLTDIREFALLRKSFGNNLTYDLDDFKHVVEKRLQELENGVKTKDPNTIENAKNFCLSFHENLLSRRINDIYDRRQNPLIANYR